MQLTYFCKLSIQREGSWQSLTYYYSLESFELIFQLPPQASYYGMRVSSMKNFLLGLELGNE